MATRTIIGGNLEDTAAWVDGNIPTVEDDIYTNEETTDFTATENLVAATADFSRFTGNATVITMEDNEPVIHNLHDVYEFFDYYPEITRVNSRS